MGDFGDNLRHEREARGVALEEISAATKISVRLLQAIENEEFDRLPGGVFNVNFVRQYARHLGLDEEQIVDEFRRLTAPAPEQEGGAPKPPSAYAEWGEAGSSEYDWDRQRQSQIWMLATFVVLAIGVAAGLYLLVSSHRNAAPAPAVSSAAPASPSSSASAPAVPGPAPASGAPETSAQAPAVEAAAKPASEAATGAARRAAETTPTARTEAPAVGAAGVDAPVRVEIRTSDRVWVSAVADGQILFQRTLQADETRVVAAQSTVRLRVGDAAALSVTLNGRPQPPLGPKGQVRTAVLTAEGMRIVPPPPKEPEAGAEGAAGGGQPDITEGHVNPAQAPRQPASRPQTAAPQTSAPPNP
ncbi:MAG TPA: RodZ domain-containing protein [Bryobacterales bacterium]|nr:RodZ domain-containing protein [Bryobacterales bacterium]